MVDEEKIRGAGVALLEEFSRELERVGEQEESSYVTDQSNVFRSDGEPSVDTGYPARFKALAPKCEDDYIVSEKGI